MRHTPFVAALAASFCLAGVARAADGVVMSTDSAKIAAVERKAQTLQARKSNRAAPMARSAASPMQGISAKGWPFLIGGVTLEERMQMQAQGSAYSLLIATAIAGSDAYLSGAHAQVIDLSHHEPVLDLIMDGPLMLVNAPPGRYLVRVRRPGGEITGADLQEAVVSVSDQEASRLTIQFPAESAPE